MSVIFVLAMFGWLGFSIMWLVSLFKRNGTAKRNFSIGVVCFLVFIITGNFVDSDEEVASDKPTVVETVASDDKTKAPTEEVSKDHGKEQAEKVEAENKVKVEQEALAKKENEEKAEKERIAREKAAKEKAAKEKAESEELARAEAEAKKPISTDFVSFDQPYEDMTDIQKKAFWKDVKGKRVQWTGTVTEVTKDSIQLKIKNTTFISDVVAFIAKEERDNLININLDETITINGELSSKKGIVLPWSLSDTIIIE
ncbi:hypothetical protein [Sporosarcina ureae]|uniref:hypothetical protein n=1 Tax=Sporosarcina ureae TaxID=1571 RepID=UPI0026EBEC95|nr:hypothetical protein [Sporosarcina ureae]